MDEREKNTDEKTTKLNLTRVIVPVFVILAVLIECAVAYFVIPSSDEIQGKAKKKMAQEVEKKQEGDAEKARNKEKLDQFVEVELGKFAISSYDPTSNTTMRFAFTLVASIVETDRSEFQRLFERNQHRLRDAIIFEVRHAQEQLAESGLGLIKRRILEKSNGLFGKAVLREIFVSDFSHVQQ